MAFCSCAPASRLNGTLMHPSELSLVAFLCIFGSAIAGIIVKSFLREDLLSEESQAIINAARGVVVGLAALTLGLLIATAKGSFDNKETELKEGTAKMIVLNRLLLKYGNQSEKARDSLRQVVVNAINFIEKTTKEGRNQKAARGEGLDELITNLLELPEQNASQTWIKTSSLLLGKEIELSRWKIYERTSGSISPLFLAILVFWLMTIFFSLGLIAPCNAIVISALFTAALSMTGAIFLTLKLDQPYGGPIQMSTEPLKMALDQFR
jgi:hypothetical protein